MLKDEYKYLKEINKKYTILYIKKEFLENEVIEKINLEEIKYGLALSELLIGYKNNDYVELALEYATIITTVVKDKKIIKRCSDILNRLTIFTFEDVLRRKEKDKVELSGSGFSGMEELGHRRKYLRNLGNEKVLLNKFQAELNDAINNYKNVSISASTSAGKSYLMQKNIIDMISKEKVMKIIYVVPTRALISQVMTDFQRELKNIGLSKETTLSCTSHIEEGDLKDRCILVLTQERLNQIFFEEGINLDINVIVVDEAQEIGGGARGVLLEYVINNAKRRWEKCNIIFLAPLIGNPETFIEKFNLEKSYSKKEEFRTVNQNLISLERIRGKSKMEIRYENSHIGEFPYREEDLSRKEKKIAYIFRNFNNNENSIIYSKIPSEARKIAIEIAKEMEEVIDSEIEIFVEFLKSYICEQYELVDLIKRGVAYHFSGIPSIIKNGIEELATKGKLKVIACTTTLLAGVNVQANNIYVYETKKKNDELTNLEFWNLIGRAGRMKYDVCGNIILINLKLTEEFPEYRRADIGGVVFAKEEIINNEKKQLENYIEKADNEFLDKNKKKIYENIESTLVIEGFLKKEDEKIEKIDKLIEIKIKENKVPEKIVRKLIGIDLKKLNLLWEKMNDCENIEECILVNPFAKNANKKLMEVLGIISEIFLENKYKSVAYRGYIVSKALKWIRENSFRQILFENKNIALMDNEKINNEISTALKVINTDIRYEMSKYIYAYQEILKEILKLQNKEVLIAKMPNYPLYLEFGAARKKTLDLMCMGFMRETAILLERYVKSEELLDIKKEIKSINIEEITCSNYIKQRLKEQINIL
ncbi:MAG: DEAD/DEAH box helicase [Clostridium sp.]